MVTSKPDQKRGWGYFAYGWNKKVDVDNIDVYSVLHWVHYDVCIQGAQEFDGVH